MTRDQAAAIAEVVRAAHTAYWTACDAEGRALDLAILPFRRAEKTLARPELGDCAVGSAPFERFCDYRHPSVARKILRCGPRHAILAVRRCFT